MNDNTYEGWTNRKTWLVALYFRNDYPAYQRTSELTRQANDNVFMLESTLRRYWENRTPRELGGFLDDYLDIGIKQDVNWREIAENFLDELKLERDYERRHSIDSIDCWELACTNGTYPRDTQLIAPLVPSDTTDWAALPLTDVLTGHGVALTDSGYVPFFGEIHRGSVIADGISEYNPLVPVEDQYPHACKLCQTITVGPDLCPACTNKVEAYQDKVTNRYNRLKRAAEKAQASYQAEHEHAHQMASAIPFGQPILVGHHSEGRDRNYRKRIENTFGRAFAHLERAQQLERKADNARTSRAISSDDPEATIKLREKLAYLEAQQEHMRITNKAVQSLTRKIKIAPEYKAARESMSRGTMQQMNDGLHEVQRLEKIRTDQFPALAPELATMLNITEAEALKLLKPDFLGRIGYPDYATKNGGAEIRRLKQRIEDLTHKAQQASATGSSQTQHGDITIVRDVDDNRLRIIFPGKPAPETIVQLKAHGFHWSPANMAWQRQLTHDAEYWATRIVEQK